MKQLWFVIKILLAVFIIYAGYQHFANPTVFEPFVPDFLGFKMPIIYISGVLEIAIGILLLTNKYQGYAAYAYFLLMLLFLPLHIWDVFADHPAIGSHKAALIRLPLQFLLIGLTWQLKKRYYKISNE